MEEKIEKTEDKKIIEISEVIQVKELAGKLNKPVVEVISELVRNGVMATINEDIDFETAAIISENFGFEAVKSEEEEKNHIVKKVLNRDDENCVPRPPIVIVMGHVDHGKTSLLDAVRKADVVASESGGITQHVGAYQVEHNGKKITFLDTPGHEAFSTMRARGAQITDVGILVVAADDGVKPQTIESINHLKSANIPFIVAINKIDKPEADIERVKTELTEHKVVPEEWGGDTVFVPVSAKTQEGLDQLLEMVLLVSEIKEPKADADGKLWATVIETHLDKGKGPVATIVVLNGSLKVGDFIVCGGSYGKVKAMENYALKKVDKAIPGDPVRILGLKDVPQVGEIVEGAKSEQAARSEVAQFDRFEALKNMNDRKSIGVKGISEKIKLGKVKELKIVLKADVRGSLEAISETLQKLANDEVAVHIIRDGVGEISESDISLASDAIIIGFRTGMSFAGQKAAKQSGAEVRLYDIIYDVVDDIKLALEELMPKEIIETEAGKARILKVFKHGKKDIILGAKLLSGKVTKEMIVKKSTDDSDARGEILGLKIVKDEVSEVSGDREFGVNIKKFIDLEEGDQITFLTREEKKKKI
jgi:translation initiation factor IF-2